MSKEYNKCWYCGVDIGAYHQDHILAKSMGGGEEKPNKALACPMCNMAKSSMPVVSFLNWLAHIRSDKFNCYIVSKLNRKLNI